MTSALTIAFSSESSVLHANFLPEINLDEEYDYSCALIDLTIKSNQNFNVTEIVSLGVLYVDCDIISESYINGVRKQTIHQFTDSTALVKKQRIEEFPKHMIYFPIKTKNLRSIQISVVDRNGKPVNISGGEFICRINIKRGEKTA